MKARSFVDAEALRLLLTDPCPNCGGTGCGNKWTHQHGCEDPCATCGGRGWTPKPELVERIADVLADMFGDWLSNPLADFTPEAEKVLVSMLEEQ